jgi:hypothetical protein
MESRSRRTRVKPAKLALLRPLQVTVTSPEDFQHDRELKVTSELDPSTVRQLTASNQTATLE